MTNLSTIQQDIQNLPKEAQILLIDFIQILKKRYPQPQSNKSLSLDDQPVIGIWSDRLEAQDSVQWVRSIRRQNWHN